MMESHAVFPLAPIYIHVLTLVKWGVGRWGGEVGWGSGEVGSGEVGSGEVG